MNVSYVKQFNANGELVNPITKIYAHSGLNRKQRRLSLQKQRFCGESKNFHLVVSPMGVYYKVRQQIVVKRNMYGNPVVKTIEHYIQK